jgi:trk system potassium uptake protein TrkH
VKTTSLAVWFARLKADLQGREDVELMGRKLPGELVNRVNLLLSLAVVWNVFGTLLLLVTQTHLAAGPMSLIFEQISAFGTVGLSTGITAGLSVAGKLWLIATMFVGRLGPLTVAVWMFPKSTVNVSYPTERIMIG